MGVTGNQVRGGRCAFDRDVPARLRVFGGADGSRLSARSQPDVKLQQQKKSSTIVAEARLTGSAKKNWKNPELCMLPVQPAAFHFA